MARTGLTIARVAGVPVLLTPSWLLVAAALTFVFAPTVQSTTGLGNTAYLVGLSYAILLLLSVLVHEVAHAVAARSIGQPVTRIVLDLWGGHTQFGRDTETPGRSFYVAVVGPLSNGVLALIAWYVLQGASPGTVTWLLLAALTLSNGLVAAFNLLPGSPLDGGRLLEAAVWKVTGDRVTGMVVSGWAGRVVAAGVVAWLVLPLVAGERAPSLIRVVVVVLVAAFLWQGAGHVLAHARVQRRLPSLHVAALMRPAAAAPSGATVAQAQERGLLAEDGSSDLVLVDDRRRICGLVDRDAIGRVAPPHRHEVTLDQVSRALRPDAVVEVDASGAAVVERLHHLPSPFLVVTRQGHVVGILATDEVVRHVTGGA